jgi:uncharacterized protein (TIGR02996 family)
MSERRAAIEAAIDDDPDDARAYAVYGDWLQEQGDPRGELIALQQAAEEDPSLAGAARACFEQQLASLGSYTHTSHKTPMRSRSSISSTCGSTHSRSRALARRRGSRRQ